MSQFASRTSVTVAAVALALLSGPVAADVVSRDDPRDTQGRLDIRRVAHGHAGEDAVTHTISTYRRFSSRLLEGPGRLFALLLFDEQDGWDRLVLVRWRNGSLRAPILDEGDRLVGMARVTRPNPRTVKITMSRSHLGDRDHYRWLAFSAFRNQANCTGWSCMDIAPNNWRGVLHRLPPPPDEDEEEEEASLEVQGSHPEAPGRSVLEEWLGRSRN